MCSLKNYSYMIFNQHNIWNCNNNFRWYYTLLCLIEYEYIPNRRKANRKNLLRRWRGKSPKVVCIVNPYPCHIRPGHVATNLKSDRKLTFKNSITRCKKEIEISSWFMFQIFYTKIEKKTREYTFLIQN